MSLKKWGDDYTWEKGTEFDFSSLQHVVWWPSTFGGNFVIDPVPVLAIRSDPIQLGPVWSGTIMVLPTASP